MPLRKDKRKHVKNGTKISSLTGSEFIHALTFLH